MKKLIYIYLVFALFSCKKDKENPEPETPVTPIVTEALSDGNFENWILVTQGNSNFEEPAGGWWTSLNTLNLLGAPITTTKSTDRYEGNYSVKLETKAWGTDFILPGLLASGYFDTSAPIGENVRQGKPFDKRPLSAMGYYKYLSIDNDSAGIYFALTKYNSNLQKRDTIAEAHTAYYQSSQGFELFNLTFNYVDTLKPDTIIVVFTSSLGGKQFIGNVGSTLWIDNVKLVY